ncbi:DUF2127 domain-containing protein [Actinopolymorpha pittospori]|uniref:Membrane protein n=1 Tax=Actinopolymorpha pittospori TaxID=648752 RepID=A0A927R8W9_9ACTN|nr:putative membrane protein [Actinopolymorpha pittospori]
MTTFKPHDWLDRTFEVGIILKGLDGLLELVGGVLLLLAAPTTINHLVIAMTQHEISEDPHDLVATHLLHMAAAMRTSTVHLAVAYLLVHGIVKVVLVAALLRGKRWAYPWMIGVLIAFIVYQLYRMVFAPTVGLAALTVFDAAIAWLTWREYRRGPVADRRR